MTYGMEVKSAGRSFCLFMLASNLSFSALQAQTTPDSAGAVNQRIQDQRQHDVLTGTRHTDSGIYVVDSSGLGPKPLPDGLKPPQASSSPSFSLAQLCAQRPLSATMKELCK